MKKLFVFTLSFLLALTIVGTSNINVNALGGGDLFDCPPDQICDTNNGDDPVGHSPVIMASHDTVYLQRRQEEPNWKSYFSATDVEDGTISEHRIHITNNTVNIYASGTYVVTAVVTDYDGNQDTDTITVIVKSETCDSKSIDSLDSIDLICKFDFTGDNDILTFTAKLTRTIKIDASFDNGGLESYKVYNLNGDILQSGVTSNQGYELHLEFDVIEGQGYRIELNGANSSYTVNVVPPIGTDYWYSNQNVMHSFEKDAIIWTTDIDSTCGFGDERLMEIFQYAVNQWDNLLEIDFILATTVEEKNDADITLGCVDRETALDVYNVNDYFAIGFGGPQELNEAEEIVFKSDKGIEMTWSPILKSRAYLIYEDNWPNIYWQNKTSHFDDSKLKRIIMHELGHALGYKGHNEYNVNSLMYATLPSNIPTNPTIDLETMRHISNAYALE